MTALAGIQSRISQKQLIVIVGMPFGHSGTTKLLHLTRVDWRRNGQALGVCRYPAPTHSRKTKQKKLVHKPALPDDTAADITLRYTIMSATLIIPGLHGSDPDHWQSWFEQELPEAHRVIQPDWTSTDLASWSKQIVADIDAAKSRVFLVAHSFGCLAAVAAAVQRCNRIDAAILVAPADPNKFQFTHCLPHTPLGFPCILVASRTDPWLSFEQAQQWANLWASCLIDCGDSGHINTETGFGPWPDGLRIYHCLRQAILRPISCCRSAQRKNGATNEAVVPPHLHNHLQISAKNIS